MREEVNDPSEEPEDYDDSELEDFTDYDDAETVQNELTYRRRIGWIQTLLTRRDGIGPAGGDGPTLILGKYRRWTDIFM